ncbi:hypothetical protein [Absidia glauca]|uniref:Uncharacterized protein n=1 Tax=Absidia glauca TaxID=4829 RepID=A0A163IRB0_ABSGL|nr:hypothetical protein [Absidia glauca]
MVLKSAFLLAVSASLVLTTQAALNKRDTPLYKRDSAIKEINKALLDQKVKDCVEKSVGLGADSSSTKYVEQVLACVNIANAQGGAQGQAMYTPPGPAGFVGNEMGNKALKPALR